MDEMEMLVKSTRENRTEIKSAIVQWGTVTDNWPDGSFNFRPTDAESRNCLEAWLETNSVEHQNIF